ncbi:MAG: 16S rRNA (cytosine(967)-C(5))-methyltransferase RsmB [Symbiobacteriaceae bacterium]|nr:16S rRNA (cytosine(967)-C(5))-methyltransferase RsmB [Symbiobacteriaceae bacterium]
MSQTNKRPTRAQPDSLPTVTTVREAVLRALINIHQGAYINLELPTWLQIIPQTHSADRGLLTELLYGTVRQQLYLDYFLARWSKQPLERLEVPLLCALRLGAYQIRFSDRIPPHAAVAATIDALKMVLPTAAGYANAVLRQACQEELWDIPLPEASAAGLAVRYSHPQWLVERWLKRWGLAATQAMLQQNNQPPVLWLRLNPLTCTAADRSALTVFQPDEADSTQQTTHPYIRTIAGVPEAIGFSQEAPLDTIHQLLRQGKLSVQDSGAMYIARSLEPLPGERILDLCAAPGGKSCHLAELMSDIGTVVAMDIHPGRSALISRQAERLKLNSIQTIVGDATVPWQGEAFAKVLLDAPCSGTGVLRRKVDARWSKDASQLGELQQLQRRLLAAAYQAVAPGGKLLYSTCSLEAEENEANIRWLLAEFPDLELTPLPSTLPFSDIPGADRGVATLLPTNNDSDGFFLALLKRQ